MHILLSSSPNWNLSHVLAATADGATVAYAGHLSVTVLSLPQRRITRCLWPQRIRVSCVAFAQADSQLVAGYEDGSARCFNWATGECLSLRMPAKSKRRADSSVLTAVVAPAWLDEPAAMFSDAGGRLLLWRLPPSERNAKLTVLVEASGSKVCCLAAAPTARQPAAGSDSSDAGGQQQQARVIAGCQDGSCILVDVLQRCMLARWRAHTSAVHSLEWLLLPPPPATAAADAEQQQQIDLSAGLVMSAGADRRITLWAVPQVAEQQQPLPQQQPAHEAAAGGGGIDCAVASAPPGGPQPPRVLQLQPIAAASTAAAPGGAGGRGGTGRPQAYYAAAAVVPGSLTAGGACLVLAAGPQQGRIGIALLQPGGATAQLQLLQATPHTSTIFQLVVQQQQQQQEQQGAALLPGAGSLLLLSAGMDRHVAATQVTLAAALPAGDGSSSNEGAASGTGSSGGGGAASKSKGKLLHVPPPNSISSSQQQLLQVQGCTPLWVVQGLGGFAYSAAVQVPAAAADSLPAPAAFTQLRVAVGCGDKTIRVATLGVRPASPTAAAAAADADTAAAGSSSADEEAAAAGDREPCSSSSQGSDDGDSSRGEAAYELQLPLPRPSLLWRNLSDRVQAVAWHPSNPRLLAFGCSDGTLGMFDVAADRSAVYSMRHGGPITQLAWQRTAHPPQQHQHQPGDGYTLLSLGGEGCLLAWPAIAPGAKDGQPQQPVDVGDGLQQLLPPPATAAAARAGGLDIARWCCLAAHSTGGVVAVGCASGQLLLLRPGSSTTHAAAGTVPAPRGGSSSDNWRRSPQQAHAAAARSTQAPSWHLLACVETHGQPVIAAAWQPDAADAAAAVAGQQHARGSTLLAAISKHHVHLASCIPAQQHVGSPAQPLSSCRSADPEQQQLLSVAWSDADTVCVGCADGSCQVLRVVATSDSAASGLGHQTLQLQPAFSLKGQSGPVLCLSGVPGWPGLLLAGSQDQTLCAWQPLRESARRGPAALLPLADASSSEQQQQQQQADAPLLPAAEQAGAAPISADQGAAAGEAAGAAVAASSPTAAGDSAPAATVLQQQQAGAPKAAAKQKQPKQHCLPPRARSFLPDLPDSAGRPGLQAQLDVVALAEALYPPPPPADAAAVAAADCWQLDDEVVRVLLGAPDAAGRGSAGGAGIPAAAGLQDSGSSSTITEALAQQLAPSIGHSYVPGSWLPTLTADVPELLLQHQQQHQQHQQQQLTASQVAMLQLLAGDTRAFLQSAVAADALTPDAVALSALGGVPAWRAATRLAAAKLAACGDAQAAALHLLAAGDEAAAAELQT